MLVKQLNKLGEVGERAGQPIDLVDHNDVDLLPPNVLQQLLQCRPIGISAREAAVIIAGSDLRPPGMSLTANVGPRSFILRIERVELLIEALVGRDAGVDGTADDLGLLSGHELPPAAPLRSRRPKNRGPFHRVPVIANATFDRLGYVVPFQAKPSARTATRCISPFHSRPSTVPGRRVLVARAASAARFDASSGESDRSRRRLLSRSRSPKCSAWSR